MVRIGYLVPEFPGQTHGFFWREVAALRALGVEPELVSTRLPPRGIVSQPWADEAMAQTTYLAPPRAADIASAGREIARGLPEAAVRVTAGIAAAEGIGAGGRLRLAGLALLGARLASLARQRGWSHLHAHSCADSAHLAMFARIIGAVPYSITLHGPLAHYGPNQRQKWQHASFAIVITRRLLQQVRAELAGSLPERVEVAPMGVDLQRFTRRTAYVPWSGEGPLLIFSCGRLNPGKAHGDLIAATSLLRAGGVDARLAIAGEDEQGGSGFRRVVAAQIHEHHLEHAVELLGAVGEDRVREGLEAAHLFALASLEEPLGVAIMEAMALAVPVVVTEAGGVPELVAHGEHGLLVPPRSPAELAAAILRVARDPELARRFGQAGRERVAAEFSAQRSARVLASAVGAAPR
jgi:glycosyltransferase involved in cell wall biosynthesis